MSLNVQPLNEEEHSKISTEDAAETAGKLLSKARQSNRQSIEKASRIIRISETYLRALEEDDHEKLPDLVYTIGFIKSYSAYLEIDAREVIEAYKKQINPSDKSNILDFPVPAPERHIPSKWLALIAASLSVLIFVAWNSMQPGQPSTPPTDNITPDAAYEQGRADEMLLDEPSQPSVGNGQKSNADSDNDSFPSSPEPEKIDAESTVSPTSNVVLEGKKLYLGPGETLRMTANDLAWVEIKTHEGETLINKTLKDGEFAEVKARDGLIFSTGNAGALSFDIDGRTYSNLGSPGQIISRFQLEFKFQPHSGDGSNREPS